MNNQLYEDNYSKIVEPKYGIKRDNTNDEILTKNISNNHPYSITSDERITPTKKKNETNIPLKFKVM